MVLLLRYLVARFLEMLRKVLGQALLNQRQVARAIHSCAFVDLVGVRCLLLGVSLEVILVIDDSVIQVL